MRTIFVVEILSGDMWVPMYSVCYSSSDCHKKARAKERIWGASRVRVCLYQRALVYPRGGGIPIVTAQEVK
jgi:hypothetical protein